MESRKAELVWIYLKGLLGDLQVEEENVFYQPFNYGVFLSTLECFVCIRKMSVTGCIWVCGRSPKDVQTYINTHIVCLYRTSLIWKNSHCHLLGWGQWCSALRMCSKQQFLDSDLFSEALPVSSWHFPAHLVFPCGHWAHPQVPQGVKAQLRSRLWLETKLADPCFISFFLWWLGIFLSSDSSILLGSTCLRKDVWNSAS